MLCFKSLHPFIKIDYRCLHVLMKLIGILSTVWKIIYHPDHTFAFIVSRASLINLIQLLEIKIKSITFFPVINSPVIGRIITCR